MIYKTFEQWMNSDFLEVGEPRKKAYSKDELLLVEMGWNYGYDAGRAVEQALDKKAENARELGLDYEPVLKDNSNYRLDPPVAEPVAWVEYETGNHTCTPPAQRTWVGLTYDEFKQIMLATYNIDLNVPGHSSDDYLLWNAIEAKLKEKNT